MRAGSLRIWLYFEKPQTEVDSDGAQVTRWVPAFDVNSRIPCALTPMSGRELIAAQAVQSKVTTRIVSRYRAGFDATMRARAPGGAVYNIEAAVPDPDSTIRYVTLFCSSGVNSG